MDMSRHPISISNFHDFKTLRFYTLHLQKPSPPKKFTYYKRTKTAAVASSTPSSGPRPRSRRSSVADGLKGMANLLISKPKQDPPLHEFRKLTQLEQKMLASIMSHQPPPNVARDSVWWTEFAGRTKFEIGILPPQLRSYPNVLERGANHLMDNELRAAYREFCPMHQKLNQKLVRSMLHWVKRDVDIHIPAMIKPLRDTGRLTADVVNLFDKMTNASGMWLEKNNFQTFFGRRVPPKWKRQEDRCAACVLGRLGSDITVLTGLKAGMLARPRKRSGDGDRRMAYVDCMIKNFDNVAIREALTESTNVGNRVASLFTQWQADGGYEAGTSTVSRSNDENEYLPNASQYLPKPASGNQPATLRQPFDATHFPGYDASPEPATSSQPSSSRFPGSSRESLSRSPPLPPPASGMLPIAPTVYEPISWRTVYRTDASRPPTRGANDTIENLIEDYRRSVYDPSFGQEDHSGFDRDPDNGAEWAGQDGANNYVPGRYSPGFQEGGSRSIGSSASQRQSQHANRPSSSRTYSMRASRAVSPLESDSCPPRPSTSRNVPTQRPTGYGHQRSSSRRGSNSTLGSIDPRKMDSRRQDRMSRGTTFTDVSRNADQRRETRWEDIFKH
jgi:hypothetical protein